jgi:soluble lytic murein transglycosylase-like protein
VSLSRRNGVDPRLVLAVVAAESAFQPNALSPVGAAGLGQLMPDTAARLGVRNRYDPLDNLQGAVRLLGQHVQHYGKLPLVLASYNAGEGAVSTYGGVPPYSETQNYVRYVLSLYRELGGR